MWSRKRKKVQVLNRGGKDRIRWWTLAVPAAAFAPALKCLSGQSSTDIMLESFQLSLSCVAHGKGSAQATPSALKLHPEAPSAVPAATKLTGGNVLLFVRFQFLTAYITASYLKPISFIGRFCVCVYYQGAQNPPVIPLGPVRKPFVDYCEEFLDKKGTRYAHKDKTSNREELLGELIIYFLFS